MTLRRARATAGALLLAAMLAGCTAAAPPAGDPAPSRPPASPTPTAPALVATPPTDAPGSDIPTEPACENVLTSEEYAAIADAGLEYVGGLSYPPPAAEDLVTDGAMGCTWRAGDRTVQYARLVESDEEWAARSVELAAQGWTVTDSADPHPGALIRYPEHDRDLQPGVLRLDGVTYFAAPGRVLGSLSGLEG